MSESTSRIPKIVWLLTPLLAVAFVGFLFFLKTVPSGDELDAVKGDAKKVLQTGVSRAKEEARKEAEKEFATNQEIKNMQAQMEKQKEEKEELERKSAKQLEELTEKLNKAITSRAGSTSENPFKQQDNTPATTKDPIDELDEVSYRQFEKDSYLALQTRRK